MVNAELCSKQKESGYVTKPFYTISLIRGAPSMLPISLVEEHHLWREGFDGSNGLGCTMIIVRLPMPHPDLPTMRAHDLGLQIRQWARSDSLGNIEDVLPSGLV